MYNLLIIQIGKYVKLIFSETCTYLKTKKFEKYFCKIPYWPDSIVNT